MGLRKGEAGWQTDIEELLVDVKPLYNLVCSMETNIVPHNYINGCDLQAQDWLCDRNSLRDQFRLGRDTTVTPDLKGIVRDAEVLVTPGSCASVHHHKPATLSSVSSDRSERSDGVALRRDVR